MSWQVMEYMQANPGATVRDVIGYFAEQLDVDTHVRNVKMEVERVQEIRYKKRPLFFDKLKKKELMQEIEMDVDLEVMTELPKGKGTEKERKAMKLDLLSKHEGYVRLKNELEGIENELTTLDDDLYDVEQAAKNGRKILDVFATYVEYVKHSTQEIGSDFHPAKGNPNLF